MGENKRYFWLKLFDNFFASKRIKRLRMMAGGDTYTIIYLKMQLKALKTDGYLYFDGVMSDFAEELALDIDEKPDDVKVTIQYLLSVGLIESSESGEEWYLTYMKNCIGSETASTQRSRDCRERKKEQEALHGNIDATQVQRIGNAEIEKEIEKEIEIEKENISSESKKDSEPKKPLYADVPAIPLSNGEEWRMPIDLYEEFVKTYPAVNVQKEVGSMRMWSLTNPTKRKTKRGVMKFVNSWLSKEQDKYHGKNDGSGLDNIKV